MTLSRRKALGLAAMGVAGTALGSTGGALLGGGAASAHGTIISRSEIWDQRTFYEGSGSASSFGYNPTFYDRLESWLSYWYANTPTSWLRPLQVWSLGAHTDHRVSEAHNAGRGFDLTRLYATVNGNRTFVVDARHNIWGGTSSAAMWRRRYWATSASLNHHFKYVLHYAYNSAHDNHFHIDNLVSGSGNSNFSTGSESQVKHVQASCTHVWGYSTAIDGVWGSQTDTNSRRVLSRIGRSGGLTTSQANWLAFNTATLRKGTGREAY